jgi:hypothetical protein
MSPPINPPYSERFSEPKNLSITIERAFDPTCPHVDRSIRQRIDSKNRLGSAPVDDSLYGIQVRICRSGRHKLIGNEHYQGDCSKNHQPGLHLTIPKYLFSPSPQSLTHDCLSGDKPTMNTTQSGGAGTQERRL